MLSKFSTKQKTLALALVIVGVIVIVWIFLFTSIAKFTVNQFTPDPTPDPPIEITYCNTIPEGICILSFGRDDSGDTVIHLFASPPTFPDFYLIVNKTSGQVIYECEKDEDEETNIYCTGEAILLGEQVEITILSVQGDIPIAAGKFAVTAILVSSRNEDSQSLPSQTLTTDSTTQPVPPFETVSPIQTIDLTTTPTTLTPAVSYPNYP